MKDHKGWDDYWAGSLTGAAFCSEGAQHPVLSSFWKQAFDGMGAQGRVLDVAAGRGALLEYLDTSGMQVSELVAVDYSVAGLASLREHHGSAMTVAADAACLPFQTGSMNLVISQFGIEYAGAQALERVTQYLAPAGRIILMSHCQGSLIYRECEANRKALEELKSLQFLPLAEEMFQSGYLVIRGQIGRKEAGAMARRVIEPFNGLRQIMDRYGEDVAGGTIRTLYEETARIQQRFQYHLEAEVMGWIGAMKNEVDGYISRMHSMMNAAMSELEVQAIVKSWRSQGLDVEREEAIRGGDDQPLAWALKAIKP